MTEWLVGYNRNQKNRAKAILTTDDSTVIDEVGRTTLVVEGDERVIERIVGEYNCITSYEENKDDVEFI